MTPLSRRTFARIAAAGMLLPLVRRAAHVQPTQTGPPAVDDREAAAQFLARHERTMEPLRALALPNALAPAPVFRPPRRRGGREERP